MFNFTILYQDAEVACAEAERFEDAREQAIEEARNSFYADVLDECGFESTCSASVIGSVSGPLSLYLTGQVRPTQEAAMNEYQVSFTDGRFVESVTVEATDRESAQEAAIEFWEAQGVVHGDIRIIRRARTLPLLPY
jgi:hypothetical protein